MTAPPRVTRSTRATRKTRVTRVRRPAPTIRTELVALHALNGTAIRARLADFAAVPPQDWFYELLYCLLTPQSSAVNAGRVVDALRTRMFFESAFNPAPVLADRKHYIRFHNTKAARLLALREQFSEISRRLSDGTPSRQLRQWLAENVDGLGLKEASHFLRNIGHRDLAILDRHILKHLAAAGVVRRVPGALTPRLYFSIERKFAAFADEVGIPMDELDLLFWSAETGQILK